MLVAELKALKAQQGGPAATTEKEKKPKADKKVAADEAPLPPKAIYQVSVLKDI